MKRTIFITVVSIIIVITLAYQLGKRDIRNLETKAPIFLTEIGYQIKVYDGWQTGPIHGGYVWYIVKDSDGFIYELCVGDWMGQLMIYNRTCLNSVSR